ncbi:MAG: insulinase family protein, partial [Ferruginibacter sp.]
IPASPPITKQSEWVAKMVGTHTQVAEDRVPQARLQKTWNVPGWGTKEIAQLELLGNILTNGKTSRLYKRLVYDDQVASNVFFYADDKEIGGQFYILADAKPGIPLSRINDIIREEMQKIFTNGPTIAELERAKTSYFAGFVKGMERIGGFGGKSDILAQNETYGGSADYYKKTQEWIKNATPADIRNVATTWLADGQYVLEINPYANFTVATEILNRKDQPKLGATSPIKFPAVTEFKLSNGLRIALVERKSVPVVNMSLMVNAGYAADKSLPGLTSLAMQMLREGTTTRTALQLSDQLADEGATLNAYADLDNSYVSMRTLKSNLDASLNIFTDVLLNPAFPQKDFERVKKEKILAIKQEQSQPLFMGLRVLPELLYGKDHAYGIPFTGTGSEVSVNKISRDNLIQYHREWFAPNNSVLIVVGDVNANELKNRLERSFSAWKQHPVPEKNIGTVKMPASPAVYIIDKPGALQSIIFAAEVSSSAKELDFESNQMMNKILGGEFSSRMNMNLREDKHWSYGASTILFNALGQGFFSAYAPVQTDKTKESIMEVQKELIQVIGKTPITDVEFTKMQGNAVSQLPGSWETNEAVLRALQEAVKYDRGIGYLDTYASMLHDLKIADIQKSAMKIIRPDNLTWLIVGDRQKIEQGIKELNLGTIKYMDAEGNVIK